jgi:stage V sporulation protein D (sporulation-specific penicillin-binding protein)
MDVKSNRRIVLVFLFIILIFLVFVGRLIYIQVVHGDNLRLVVEKQKKYERTIHAERGFIFDRNGQTLAYTDSRYKITLNRKSLSNQEVEAILKDVSIILPFTELELQAMMLETEDSTVVIDYVEDETAANKLIRLGYNELWVDQEFIRRYPNDGLAAHILGFTRPTKDPLVIAGEYGVERYYNELLTGYDGLFRTETDRKNNQLVYSSPVEIPKQDGYDLHLTLDSVIQHHLEKALENGFNKEGAIAAHGIVMDVNTGEILGLASYPTFNPNDKSLIGYDQGVLDAMDTATLSNTLFLTWKNRIVEDSYELGSTIKLITTALALENNIFTPDSKFNEGSKILVGGKTIRSWYYPENKGVMTLTEAVAISCNVVFVRVGQALGIDILYDGFRSFGLFDKTGIELGGEASGQRTDYENAGPTEIATMTFGHGVAFSPLQVATAITSLVNGGELIKPQIVKKITAEDGSIVQEAEKTVVRKVVSEITSQQIKDMMENVVDSGGAAALKTPGLRVGAKTGTAEKLINGDYQGDKVLSSVVAVAPINNPEILIYIILDEPENIYGSQSAAPVAKEVLDAVADYLEFPRSMEGLGEIVMVPDLVGLTVEEGIEILNEMGLKYKINDQTDGMEKMMIINQYPKAGTERNIETKVLLEVMK